MVAVAERERVRRAAPAAVTSRSLWSRVSLVALSLTMLLQTFRLLLPQEWTKSSDIGLVMSAVTFPLLFLAPLFAPLYQRLGARGGLATAVALLAAGRIALQAYQPAPFWLAVGATGLALTAIVAIVATAVGGRDGPMVGAYGVLVGLALDAAVRGAFGTWDPAWRSGVVPTLVTLALVAALVTSMLVVTRTNGLGITEPTRGRAPRAAVLGLLLAPEVLFLQSPAFVGSSAGVSLAWSVAIVVGAGAVALAAADAALRRPSRPVGIVAGVLLAVAIYLCPSTTGAAAAVLVVGGQVLAAVVLATALTSEPATPRRSRSTRTAFGATVGLLVSYIVLLGYQLHYEHRLPFSNAWLPVVAVVAATACLFSARRDGHRTETGVTRPSPIPLALLASGIVAAAFAVAGGLATTATHSTIAAQATWPLRVMTFNVGGAVTRSGEVDPDAIADRIRSSGADVVVLQEVYRGWPLGGTVDVAAWLQHELGWQQLWAPAADNQAGNLLLSRVRLTDRRAVHLPRGGGSMDRSAAAAKVVVNGTIVEVVGTHLQHRNSAASMAARQDEIALLLRLIAGQPNVVLMGDLNPRNPDLVDLRTLMSHGLTTTLNSTRCVQPTSNDNCSDYVFVGSGLRQVATSVVPTSPFDHRPVMSVIAPATR